MAKPNWLTVDPMQGNGDMKVKLTFAEHTGRENRSGVVTFKDTSSGAQLATLNVEQEGKGVFITADSVPTVAASPTTTYQVRGRSNATRLNFPRPSDGSVSVPNLPTNYTVNGQNYAANATITGDPGATAEYEWAVNLTFSENKGTSNLTYYLWVQSGSVIEKIKITQSGSAATLRVDESEVTGESGGWEKDVNVYSNTRWSVE